MSNEEKVSPSKKRLISGLILAARYREETGLIGGYVMVLWGEVIGFCNEFPEISLSKSPGNPMLVDDQGGVFQVEERKWKQRKINILDPTKNQSKKNLADHIADVLRVEMIYVYSYAAQQINDWFNACKVPLNHIGWRRLEYLKICEAFVAMMSGRPLDSLLGKAKES